MRLERMPVRLVSSQSLKCGALTVEEVGLGATSRQIWWPALLGLISFALALLTRTALIDEPLIYDEHYHFLPAQSWLAEGTLRVLDGVYERGALFTKLVAASFETMSRQDPAAARLIPSVIPGALLVSLVFLWTRSVVGTTAGWVVLLFLLLWPNGIEVSQYIRFYALQGLLFIAGALLVYGGMAEGILAQRRMLMLAVSVPLFFLALQLQMLTLIGLGAIGIWVAIVLLPNWLRAHRWLWWPVIAIFASGAAVLVSGALDETISRFWKIYNWAPWPSVPDPTFYHRYLRDSYPTFWPFFPLAALVALCAHPRAASFCLILFGIAFLVISFGALKGVRYLYSSMPFFFVLWAIALQALLPVLWRGVRETASGASSLFLPARGLQIFSAGAVGVSLLFLFGANAAFERAVNLVRGHPDNLLMGKTRWTWPEAYEMTAPWLAKGAVVVTSEEMLAVKWLGGFDIGYNRPRFSELQFTISADVPPFTPDWRTGRPMIGNFKDFERVIACEPVGLFISHTKWLDSGGALRMAEAARATAAEVTISRGVEMALLAWERPAHSTFLPSSHSCEDLTTAIGDRIAKRLQQ